MSRNYTTVTSVSCMHATHENISYRQNPRCADTEAHFTSRAENSIRTSVLDFPARGMLRFHSYTWLSIQSMVPTLSFQVDRNAMLQLTQSNQRHTPCDSTMVVNKCGCRWSALINREDVLEVLEVSDVWANWPYAMHTPSHSMNTSTDSSPIDKRKNLSHIFLLAICGEWEMNVSGSLLR